jgi:hypothetical protein
MPGAETFLGRKELEASQQSKPSTTAAMPAKCHFCGGIIYVPRAMKNKRQAISCMANKQQAMSFPAHPECAIRQMDKLKKGDRQGIEGFLLLSDAGLLDDERRD